MRDYQSQQPTERMAESTIDGSRQTMERLIDLQRNMAEMTLSALEWGESAQRQGIEVTQSMLESAPGPQFTASMVERYLEGMEAIVPEMEQAMEAGTRAVTQPGTPGATGTGRSRGWESQGQQYQGQQGGGERGRATGGRQRPTHRSMGERQRPSQQSMGGRQPTGQQSMSGHQSPPNRRSASGQQPTQQPMSGQQRSTQPMAGQQSSQQQGGQQASSDRSQSRRPQQSARSGQGYPGTGEWVTPQEYGGESTGTTEYQQRPLSAAPNQPSTYGSQAVEGQPQEGGTGSRQGSQAPPSTGVERSQQGGHDQSGGPMGDDRARAARAGGRPTEGGQSEPEPGRTEQGRLRDQYSRRAGTDRGESEQGGIDRGEEVEPDQSSERRGTADTDAPPDQPQPPTERATTDEPTEEE